MRQSMEQAQIAGDVEFDEVLAGVAFGGDEGVYPRREIKWLDANSLLRSGCGLRCKLRRHRACDWMRVGPAQAQYDARRGRDRTAGGDNGIVRDHRSRAFALSFRLALDFVGLFLEARQPTC